jgi:hypothetical protein
MTGMDRTSSNNGSWKDKKKISSSHQLTGGKRKNGKT